MRPHKTLVWVDSGTLKSNQSSCQSTCPGLRILLTLKKHLKVFVCSFWARANTPACVNSSCCSAYFLLIFLLTGKKGGKSNNRAKHNTQVHRVRDQLVWGCFLEQNNRTVCVKKVVLCFHASHVRYHDVLDMKQEVLRLINQNITSKSLQNSILKV